MGASILLICVRLIPVAAVTRLEGMDEQITRRNELAALIKKMQTEQKTIEQELSMIDLVYRNETVQTVQAHCIYRNDDFQYELGLEPKLHHIPAFQDRGELIGVYAMFRLQNGGYGFEVMSKADVDQYAMRYSQAVDGSFSPWTSNYEEIFMWEDFKVCAVDAAGKPLPWSYLCHSREDAERQKEELLKKYPCVVLRNNETREGWTYYH